MNEKKRIENALAQNAQWNRKAFFGRPHVSRREMFRLAGGLTGAFLTGAALQPAAAMAQTSQGRATPKNTAKNVIFILLAGAPSHTDLFDLKMIDGVTPPQSQGTTLKGNIAWPVGILPKLGQQIDDLAIIRSMRAKALVHSLSQTWIQIGRSPVAVLGDIAPNIGSIVALEKTPDRTPKNVLPTFLALNSNGAVGSGYFDSRYAPFKTAPSANGLANTQNSAGEVTFTDRFNVMQELDSPLRNSSPYGKSVEDMDDFYRAARGLMYNPDVDKAFKYTAADSARYGGNGFGNACLTAKQVLEANDGTRFIQITLGGWDMHNNIYTNGATTIFTLGKVLDDGTSALISDLRASGLLNDTLIVAVGEFGRTVGRLTAQGGRDHYPQQFAVFAGGGIKGGRAIGSTDPTGAYTENPGWSRERDVYPEDIEATILSAVGIDWTTIRNDDPLGRGFEYVPGSKDDLFGPVHELWG